jgi:hypothetical protein
MDNVQNCDSYINIPSSQTYRAYSFLLFVVYVVFFCLCCNIYTVMGPAALCLFATSSDCSGGWSQRTLNHLVSMYCYGVPKATGLQKSSVFLETRVLGRQSDNISAAECVCVTWRWESTVRTGIALHLVLGSIPERNESLCDRSSCLLGGWGVHYWGSLFYVPSKSSVICHLTHPTLRNEEASGRY